MLANITNHARPNRSLGRIIGKELDPNDTTLRKEGFWSAENIPVTNREKWKGQYEFLSLLRKREGKAKKQLYKRLTACKICKTELGTNTEYHQGHWIWNNELSHYVEVHNVKPTSNFIRFVCRIEEK